MKSSESKYREALTRLLHGKGEIVKGNYEINLDTIALECGLKRGSIRKSRLSESFLDEIESATNKLSESKAKTPESELKLVKFKLSELNSSYVELTKKYEAAIAREMNLAYELMCLKQELAEKTSSVVKFNPLSGRFEG